MRCCQDIQVQISSKELQNWKESGVDAVAWGILSKEIVTETTELLRLLWTHMNSKNLGLKIKKANYREFPGGPVVRTPRFRCWGPGFDPWSGN